MPSMLSEVNKIPYMSARRRAENGFAVLTNVMPGFYDKIDLEHLDMSSGEYWEAGWRGYESGMCGCMLAQINYIRQQDKPLPGTGAFGRELTHIVKEINGDVINIVLTPCDGTEWDEHEWAWAHGFLVDEECFPSTFHEVGEKSATEREYEALAREWKRLIIEARNEPVVFSEHP